MTWQTEFWSWMSPTTVPLGNAPSVGDEAPSTDKLRFPVSDGKSTIVSFLRHCGCPFAEKTFLQLRDIAAANPQIHFAAISHSDQASTDRWLAALPDLSKNKQPNLQVVVDVERELYGAWGLGISSFWHVLGSIPSVSKLDKEDGIKVRSTESGNRWQTAGNFAVDEQGVVKWSRVDERADDMPDFKEGIGALQS
ncbi:hypothetical protein DE146DRAFT_644574 [Phaeosphaeria sp. MPI-PUGE-AT-0046c]|nr:hypothetical protein DE146DRAFT_644574 [Phaeosphaeria sp. MPI-PUGE-AT-0046c]